MTTTTSTIAGLAREAYDAFETATREDGTRYTCRKDDAPEWVQDLTYAAHGDFLPDDWRYDAIRSALQAIADDDEDDFGDLAHEWADGHVDIYNAARFAWLASHGGRASYVDEATEEFGPAEDVTEAIGRGQYLEALEVFGAVLAALEDRLEEVEAA